MADPPTDYVAYWPMDGNLSPGGGTPVGSPTYPAGKVGSALATAGVGVQYVTITAPLTVTQMRAAWTVCAWVQDSDPAGSHGGTSMSSFFNIFSSATDFIACGRQTSLGMSCQFTYNSTAKSSDQSGGTVLPTNTWIHLAYTWDGATLVFYRNGTSVAITTGVHTAPNTTAIALLYTPAIGYWDGLIDELRVYAYALSLQQVNDCMNYTGVVPQVGTAETDGAGVFAPAGSGIFQASTLR